VECAALSAQWVHADRVRLKQMLYNLLSNGVKFTSSGGKVTVESEFEDEFVKISVTDTGAGIREQDLGLIFEEFARQVEPGEWAAMEPAWASLSPGGWCNSMGEKSGSPAK